MIVAPDLSGEQDNELIPAIYAESALHQAGNPLIDALPRFKTARELLGAIGTSPEHAEEDRLQDAYVRMLLVLGLRNFFVPLQKHFAVVEQMGLVIRGGYEYRNPAGPDFKKAQVEFYRQSMKGAIVPITLPKPSTAPSFSIFGVSGMGKSSIVERILSYYPQALIHPQYRFMQLVWLKVDCPLDGSLKQLLLSIIAQIDKKLGTKHYRVVGNRTEIDKLVLDVAKIAAQHNVGVLVIDEIQHLLDAPGVGLAKMLNFFVTFANDVKVPFVLVGTPRAEKLLSVMFREARRVSDAGTIYWDRMKPGTEWRYFIDRMWPFQWTAKPTPLTDELSDAMFFETQGITALAVRLYQLVQLEAIRSEKELITKRLISEVASESFALLQPALGALRSGKASDLALFEDFFNGCIDAVDGSLQSASLQKPSIVPEPDTSGRSWSAIKLKKNLEEVGVPPNEAAAIVREVLSRNRCNDGIDDTLVNEISAALRKDGKDAGLIAMLERAKADGSDMVSELKKAGLLIHE
ncbi:ATP-binding protein [Bradyrhizobium lablabi]|uniref:ATP-binding protein n=1 Tax=Bradyrhizobium lablabi TaxID=722472 RepID=UPI001BA9B3F3|nr:ATP-binding protein [Bradyrhizobium lablabi]MBR0695331.1 ATP-binding protein [Bradyrhizobium lablabi]